jgi:hypothetical protein
MEDIRTYRTDEEETRDDERNERLALPPDDEVPFHIPRD